MNRTPTPWPALCAVAVAAILASVRTLNGGWLSDDLLLDFFTDHDAAGMHADWGQAFADFTRPWLGLPAPLYRPMVSVSMASDLASGAGDALPFHLTNIVLHVVFAVLCGSLCAELVHRRKALAALLGGTIVALHPVAIEPIAWIAARNSSLEIVFHATALVCFVRAQRKSGPIARAGTTAGALLALCSKESAVVLPISILAVDLLARPNLPRALRVRTHVRLLPLWIGYGALRLLLFGGLGTATTSPGDVEPITAAATKLHTLFAPPVTGNAWLDLLATPLWIAAAFTLFRGRLATLAICAAWLCAHLAPTFRMPVLDGLSGSRLIYGALLPLSVMVACAAARAPRMIGALAVPMLVLGAIGGAKLSDHYVAGWEDMRAVAADLARYADAVEPGRPLVVAAMPPTPFGLPPFNHNGWFAIGWPPQQDRAIAVDSAGYVVFPTPGAEPLHHDGSPLCALWEQGCTLLTWDPVNRKFLARRRPEGTLELPALTRQGEQDRFAFATPVPAAHLQQVTIRATRGSRSGRLFWRCAVPDLPRELAGIDFADGVEDGDATRFEIDLTHSLGLPSLATFGISVDTLDIQLEDGARVLSVAAAPRIPELPLERQHGGHPLDVAAFLATLSAPAPRPGVAQRAIVQTAMGAVVVPLDANGKPTDRVPLLDALRVLRRASRDAQVLYWIEALSAPGAGGFARSRVDRFTLIGEPD